jgi:hypothetical protein
LVIVGHLVQGDAKKVEGACRPALHSIQVVDCQQLKLFPLISAEQIVTPFFKLVRESLVVLLQIRLTLLRLALLAADSTATLLLVEDVLPRAVAGRACYTGAHGKGTSIDLALLEQL